MIPAVDGPFGRRLPPWLLDQRLIVQRRRPVADRPLARADGPPGGGPELADGGAPAAGVLRPWLLDDALPLWAAWPREWARLGPVLPWWGRTRAIPAEWLEPWLRRQQDQTARGQAWWLALSGPPNAGGQPRRLLGGVSASPVGHWGMGPRAARLGCWLFAEAEGQGWMRAAFATLIWHLWTTTDVRTIFWRTPDTNRRAHALNRRLGGAPTGQLRRTIDSPQPVRQWRLDCPADPVQWARAQGLTDTPSPQLALPVPTPHGATEA